MIRNREFYEALSEEGYQKLIILKRELEEAGSETTMEILIAVAIEVAEEKEWKKKIMERE